MSEQFESHRCKQLLEHNKIELAHSICIRKYLNPTDFEIQLHHNKWGLYQTEDDGFCSYYLTRVTSINVCPFCGEKLS